MFISLIITTFNWREALELSLMSALRQTRPPDEIVIADDGSEEDTAGLIRRMAADSSVPIIHSWQENRGFRLARSRNKAMLRSRGDYIILIDGDIILEPHFVEDHLKFARPGTFVQGSRVLLGRETSARALREKRLAYCFMDPDIGNRKNCLRNNFLARLFSFHTRCIGGVKTCNFAFWFEDALRVNGFNEDFEGWGREDSEFTARLLNSGLRRRNVRFNAIGYHLYHPMNDRSRLPVNDRILERTVREKLTWCDKGLDGYKDYAGLGGRLARSSRSAAGGLQPA